MNTQYLLIAVVVYLLINAVAFLMYVRDKKKAERGEWRTPEATLIGIALFGPFGALAGMLAVRHKTQKLKFKLVYVFLVLHVVLIAFLVGRYMLGLF